MIAKQLSLVSQYMFFTMQLTHYVAMLVQGLRQENVKVVAIHPGTSSDIKSVLVGMFIVWSVTVNVQFHLVCC